MSMIHWDRFGDVNTFFRLIPGSYGNRAPIPAEAAAARKSVSDVKSEKMHRIESVVGKFERSFALPEDVNAAVVTCASKDGILTVHIPKMEKPKHTPTQITVQ